MISSVSQASSQVLSGVAALGVYATLAGACWVASRRPVKVAPGNAEWNELRARIIESGAIALALIVRWLLDHYLFMGQPLERPAAVVLAAYVLLRAVHGGGYLLPCAAVAIQSLVRSDGSVNAAWIVVLQCALITSLPVRVLLTSVPLAFAIYDS
jgi:hypothetical protein